MPRKKNSGINCYFLSLIILGCLVLTTLVICFVCLPSIIEDEFGKSAPGMSLLNRFYYAIQLLVYEDDLITPLDPAGIFQNFTIKVNEPASSVIYRLQSEGLIKNAEAMRIYLLYSGLDTALKAGTHQLSSAMSPVEIANTIQTMNQIVIDFSVLPGWRVEEIAASLPTSGLQITPQQFIQSSRQFPAGLSFSKDLPETATCEGFLFPDVIQVPRTASADQLIQSFLQNFDQNLSEEIKNGFTNQGLTLYQAVILASIVEREAIVDDEMPLIASVYINRLSSNMKLDADPTVQYALGFQPSKQTWWANPLSMEDLQIDSPFNTYLYPGLPPAPIANPGMDALRAVAYPQSSPYLYFRSACDGSGRHNFAQTYEEQLANACP